MELGRRLGAMRETEARRSVRRKRKYGIGLACLFAVALLAYSQVSIFVVPPSVSPPYGRTLLVIDQSPFFDSTDAFCHRIQRSVTPECRVAVLRDVEEGGTVILRMPYSETIYLLSTGGRQLP
jgi:hypothetical protein